MPHASPGGPLLPADIGPANRHSSKDEPTGSKGLTRRAPSRQSASLSPARWRSGYAEDCKSLHAGSIPARASTSQLRSPPGSRGRHGRSADVTAHSSDRGPPVPPNVAGILAGRGGSTFLAESLLARAGAAQTGVTADASIRSAPAVTTTRLGEGDFPGAFTHTSRHGSGWRVPPSRNDRPPSRSRFRVRPPQPAGMEWASTEFADRSRSASRASTTTQWAMR